jgi:ADP-ribose pyrophosphatase
LTELSDETLISRKIIFEGKIMTVRVDTVRLPNGAEATREVVDHADAVTIVPVDGDGNVVLVRQYRHPLGMDLLELPAGGIEEGEEPVAAAQRELREETGLAAGKLVALGGFYSAPGFLTEYLHLFLATDLTESPLAPDPDEFVEVVRIPIPELKAMISRGDVQDSKTIAGVAMALESNHYS